MNWKERKPELVLSILLTIFFIIRLEEYALLIAPLGVFGVYVFGLMLRRDFEKQNNKKL